MISTTPKSTPDSATPLRKVAKTAFFWGYINILRRLPNRYLGRVNRQRIVILLYHRVTNNLSDAVTVSVDQFEAQMRWLHHNCPVVCIDDLLDGRVSRQQSHPLIAVTFDDGYLDNYENAVPILNNYKIPATFFVSTGMIGSDNGFPHDLDKLGYALPNMSWDHLREMSDMGFQIGSHTVSHLNCATSPRDKVWEELVTSKTAITEQLGIRNVPFAYPFGGRDDIDEEAVALVKRAGYSSCFSAFGGYVGSEMNRYDIPRVGISSNFSLLAFRARLQGFR